MHCENNYPLFKEESSLDVPVPVGANDEMYLTLLKYANSSNILFFC